MISTPDREKAVRLIDEAVTSGARKRQACEEMGITLRSYQRWTADGGVKADGGVGHADAVRPDHAGAVAPG